MANDSHTQQRLAVDVTFQGRIRSAIANVAWSVLGEDPGTPNHDARVTYARAVINSLSGAAQTVAAWIVERPNLLAFATTYDFVAGAVVTAATDADIESQLATDWDVLAGTSPAPALAAPTVPPGAPRP
jgi:hypothetical protein